MKTTSKNTVLVSILNWNNSKATNACVRSALDQAYGVDVVVSDNDSRVEIFELDKTFSNRVTVWKNSTNLGFAGGHNKAIQHAVKHGYDYVMLLNNDAVLTDKDDVSKLVTCMVDPLVRAVAPLIVYEGNRDAVWFGGGELNVSSASSRHLYVGEHVSAISQDPVEVSFLTGCCVLIRIDGIRQLDERYFLYWEDADWCADVLAHGERLVFCPEAIVAHNASMSLGIRSPRYVYYNIRNQLLFARKWARSSMVKVLFSTSVTGLKYTLITTLKQPLKAPRVMYTALKAQYHGVRGKTGQL